MSVAAIIVIIALFISLSAIPLRKRALSLMYDNMLLNITFMEHHKKEFYEKYGSDVILKMGLDEFVSKFNTYVPSRLEEYKEVEILQTREIKRLKRKASLYVIVSTFLTLSSIYMNFKDVITWS